MEREKAESGKAEMAKLNHGRHGKHGKKAGPGPFFDSVCSVCGSRNPWTKPGFLHKLIYG
jgi:hypothetical protein